VNPPRLLLDEQLSPTIAVTLRHEGVDAIHVRDRGLNAASDADLFAKAFDEDRIVVTMNVRDFEYLARTCNLHAGVVLVEDSGLDRDEQLAVVRAALALIAVEHEAGRSMVNRVLRIWADGRSRIEELP